MTPRLHEETLAHVRRVGGPEGLEKLMDEQALDVVLTGSDSMIVAYAAWLGWPVGTFPVGTRNRYGQPWGMFAVARKGREDLILQVMEHAMSSD
jgi:amidase